MTTKKKVQVSAFVNSNIKEYLKRTGIKNSDIINSTVIGLAMQDKQTWHNLSMSYKQLQHLQKQKKELEKEMQKIDKKINKTEKEIKKFEKEFQSKDPKDNATFKQHEAWVKRLLSENMTKRYHAEYPWKVKRVPFTAVNAIALDAGVSFKELITGIDERLLRAELEGYEEWYKKNKKYTSYDEVVDDMKKQQEFNKFMIY